MLIRVCKRCGIKKEHELFVKNPFCKNGIKHTCKQCDQKNKIKWVIANPDYQNDYRLFAKYKLTRDQYLKLVQQQDNKCKICGNEETVINIKSKKIQNLSVDHNHETGKLRDLLCSGCNIGLGYFKENITSLESAIKYLRKHNESK